MAAKGLSKDAPKVSKRPQDARKHHRKNITNTQQKASKLMTVSMKTKDALSENEQELVKNGHKTKKTREVSES